MVRKFFMAVPIVAVAIGGSTACATKKFVRTSVGEVNEKVDAQGRAIEETQERTRRNEGRISDVDQKAGAAALSAQAAKDAAAAAHGAANEVGGRVFISSTPSARSLAARQMVDELRHQYFIAFEASVKPGWHPLVVRAHNKDLTVRARNGYNAGQSRANSF